MHNTPINGIRKILLACLLNKTAKPNKEKSLRGYLL